MVAALRPADFPDAPPLRAKSLGKIRNKARFDARSVSVRSLYRAARAASDSELGAFVDEPGQRSIEGARVRTGSTVLMPAEVALLLPLGVGIPHLVDCIKERLVRESIHDASNDGEKRLRIRLALTHVDALLATIT